MDLKRKFMRMAPVLKVRKAEVDKETSILSICLNQKNNLQQELKKSQMLYLNGVENLNTIRQSSNWDAQESIANSVDNARERWIKIFKEIQLLDSKIALYRNNLYQAQLKLKQTEKLSEKARREWHSYLNKCEQESLEELFLNRKTRLEKESL